MKFTKPGGGQPFIRAFHIYLWISELGVDGEASVPAASDFGAALAVAGNAVPRAVGAGRVHVQADDPHLGGERGEEAAAVAVKGQAVFDDIP